MTNSVELRALIKESGYSYKHIAKKLGITYYGLKNKLDNVTEFRPSEIVILCDLLGIKDPADRERIFFARK